MGSVPQIIVICLNPSIDKTIAVPRLQNGLLNRAIRVNTDVGGKGVNVAKTLSNFGLKVHLLASVGGRAGEWIERELKKASGLGCSFYAVDGETRTNYKIHDLENLQVTEINEPGAQVSEQLIDRICSDLRECTDQNDFVVLSGSLPQGCDSSIYGKIIREMNEGKKKSVLDADRSALKFGVEGVPFMIKPNLMEFQELVSCDLKTEDDVLYAALPYISRGIQMVTVSIGSRGALWITEEKALRTIPPKIAVGSTVAAGDSMLAGMVFGRHSGMSLEETACFATCAGTVTASKSGTELCSFKEVYDLYHSVKIRSVKEGIPL